ncbi:EAL domain-containing protein [Nitrogeniibacter mangrovi]|uniref:EAL domain-containing protein n=1 Tax=Nitrogeniibacter mangrovi TaxID=2016596 RepID=A0A6C1B2M8_9RHOO|nr:EAL domain-containing protein [Nitrogeniibacter mangrovi]QID17239.1 EAL domain-containing protein [Nitrogeniibacter mangrovi]
MTVTDALLNALMSEADTLLLGLFDNALVGVYVIQDDRFVYVNATLAAMFGYTQDEVCGKLGPLDLTDADQQPIAQSEIDKRLSGQAKASFYGFQGTRKDGSTFDAEVFGVATRFQGRTAIIGILTDVTKRRVAERDLADKLHFIAGLMETIPNPVFYKDEQGRYLGCNKAFEAFLGTPREALIGRSVFEISPPELAARYHAADQALFDHPGTQVYEAQVKGADGEYRDVIFYKATFERADGALGGLLGVVLDITDRKRMEAQIRRDAYYDTLTGLPNRRLFEERVAKAFEQARHDGSTLALLFIDLDRFKDVNDTLGHRTGDLLLAAAGQRIQACLQPGDTVARWSGDEFIAALPEVGSADTAGRIAQRILDTLAAPFVLDGQPTTVTASVGMALFPDDGDSVETLMSYADQGMYIAKTAGRNGFCQFIPAHQAAARARRELASDLREALANDQFQLLYQPIVRLDDLAVVKAEALIRWHHPRLGLIPPDRFIPLAEEINLIGEIGDWVFRQASHDVVVWNDARSPGSPVIQVSVNKSPRQILTGKSEEIWLNHLTESAIPPEYVAIEITEGLLLDASAEVVRKLEAFRRSGVQISLDDFGTGYSAMAYLKKFAIDTLKIDRSFVKDMLSNPSDRAIVEAVIAMAHKLGIQVIAEGVETEAHSTALSEAGCDFGQGYHFARPMPADAFEIFLAQRSNETTA